VGLRSGFWQTIRELNHQFASIRCGQKPKHDQPPSNRPPSSVWNRVRAHPAPPTSTFALAREQTIPAHDFNELLSDSGIEMPLKAERQIPVTRFL
jgi:hypothetical protein